ncbi:MAG: 16S rRNA (guanine(966)-N(2))-methyltransferase RsmD [Cycloclasticus sp.]|jgi:16S rRNA (guanine966-N2)-methyltransferase|nr:MAG: 16S rRNA (guanine(966)-N(2))-methyltransferase RsmD [Cycloclasticus sp. Phe_18]MBV1913002.1 16S rRNA (guanine(966)-N(2))-methyltransferase RsmD [Cycloclasticus sp.]MEE4291365.1 16S rRNA (guanine(966)-N(2))-methyltransferase RsmD [Cycloclasticus sp.]
MAAKGNRVRIIGGQWRGRKIEFPSIDGLRPTTDPVRETLFNWLQPYLPQSNCLDLYAGSGALGFEAASRGARHVLMVEQDSRVVKALRTNKEIMQAANVQLMHRPALDALKAKRKETDSSFDIVFLDPPFNQGELIECVKRLEESGYLSDDAVIYLECESTLALDFLPKNWLEHRRKKAGQVTYYLYQRELDGE